VRSPVSRWRRRLWDGGITVHGTLDRDGTVIEAVGAEVFEFADERIKEIRDHHRVLD
jgi:hypothetical protein